MNGINVAGVACICSSCKRYSAYMPVDDIDLSKHYMRKRCPLCGAELVIKEVEYRGY